MSTTPINYLELSDEELMKLPAPDFNPAPMSGTDIKPVEDDNGDNGNSGTNGTGDQGNTAPVVTGTAANPDDNADGNDSDGGDNDADDDKDGADGDAGTGNPLNAPDDSTAKLAADKTGDKQPEAGKDGAAAAERSDSGTAKPDAAGDKDAKGKNEEDPSKGVQAQIDYEKEYKRLTAPFKANGKEIAVESVDDAIQLMQMGANYGKKMQALKPILKLTKMLENNGLLNEEKISYLIDLSKGNAGAINKLVTDSKIDPMDLSADKAGEYKQSSYAVADSQIELDEVLDDIQHTPTYTKTLEVVTKKWDEQSKRMIADAPKLLKVINTHMETGIYDLIAQTVERERTFGRLSGLTDIEAYRQVGDALQAQGKFNHLVSGSSQSQKETAPPPVVAVPKPKVDEAKLKDQRRAASSTKPAAPSPNKAMDFNPLAMSDEEFAKQASSKFL